MNVSGGTGAIEDRVLDDLPKVPKCAYCGRYSIVNGVCQYCGGKPEDALR